MAVMDQDNFSNISWHSEQNNAAAASSRGPGPEQPESDPAAGRQQTQQSQQEQQVQQLEHQHQQREEVDPELNALDSVLGGETLDCTVGSPIKENDGAKDAFVSYQITTNTSFPFFQKPVTQVRRRFTDFLFLYKALCKDYPACAVPPLPDKQRMEYVRGDRFGSDFTNRRAYSLQRFLARIALHPILRRSAMLHTFLESPDWNATMRSRSARGSAATPGAGADPGSGGVFDNFADTFINAFTKVHRPDRRFIEVKEKSDKLDEDLGSVEKVVARVVRREADLELDLRDLAEQFQRLITLEPGVEPALHAFSASVEDSAAGLRHLKELTDQDYLGSLRDLAAYSGALKNLLRAREQKQLDFEQLTEYLHKSTQDRDALASGYGGGGGASGMAGSLVGGAGGFIRSKIEDVRGVDHEQSRRERQRKLELRIEELTREVETAKKTSELFDDEVVKEVVDFERIKRVELKRQFGGLADSHIEFYGGVVDIWERYVREMEKEGVVLPA